MTQAIPWVLVLASGCGTINPPGFNRLSRSEPVAIEATPGHMYGFAPRLWSLPGGRQVRVEARRSLVASAGVVHHADLAFDVGFEDGAAKRRGRSKRLRCETDPSGSVPDTRFGCWSIDDSSHRFWMASRAECPSSTEVGIETLTTPECWVGELVASGRRYQVAYGRLQASSAAIDRISWIDSTGATVLAADLVSELRIELFPDRHPRTMDDDLVLQTIALHWWGHAARRR